MAAPRSTEASQGSAGVGSGSRPPANPAFSNARVSHYVHESIAPVNAALQFGVSCERDHTKLVDTVDFLLSSQQQAGNPALVTPSGSHSEGGQSGDASVRSMAADVADSTKGVGARFE
ncbi:hypothetical protein F4820DRAFT_167052 [Hypoxylon rubiginosum]|uniref:Uncharacterized protein n=1 Tax=Hypoxylon rubiginosum TaxID=110542 RepID=A0ACB9YKF8_9PEZI|nr:hypothetical protein F4820DRAFT_167052 [Hypoxylon rubiginosum]